MATVHDVNCIIWCWISTTAGNKAIPYPPLLSREIEQGFHSSSTRSYTASDNTTVDYNSMIQISGPRGRGRVPSIQRCLISLPSSPHLMAYWEWDSGHHEGYLPYIIPALIDIEIGYLNKLSFIDLSTCPSRVPYTVDYTTMRQCRRGYGTHRNIRRVPLRQPLQEILREQSSFSSKMSTISSPASSLISSPSSSVTTKKRSSSKKKSPTAVRVSISKTPSPTSLSSSTSVSSSTPSSSSSSRPVTRSTSRGATGKGGKIPPATTPSRGPSSGSSVKSRGTSSSSGRRKDKELETVLGSLSKFVKRVSVLNFGEDGPCPICMNNLSEESGFEDESPLTTTPTSSSRSPGSCDVCKLRKCGHMIHTPCLIMYSKSSNEAKGCIRCPTCKVIHGIHTGDMPNTGTMNVSTKRYSLPGHEGYDTFEIVYNFSPGVQNGVSYRANGFPRNCYLPACPKGKKILKLLKIAWDRRLTFTIGTSVTTGATNTIVWNEIHHKTEALSNSSGHGYPDGHYLENVLAELASQGVIEEEREGEETGGHYSSDSDL